MTTTIQITVEHPINVSSEKVAEVFKMLLQIGKSDALQTLDNGGEDGDIENASVAASLEFGEPLRVS